MTKSSSISGKCLIVRRHSQAFRGNNLIFQDTAFRGNLDCAKAQKSGFQAVLAGITMHTIGLIYSINKNQDCGPVSMQKIQEACVLMRGKHLRQVYTGRYRRIHQHELFQFQGNHSSNTLGSLPHQYMLQLKLSKIKDLLSSTEMSIQDIAMKLNFESADYFSYFSGAKQA